MISNPEREEVVSKLSIIYPETSKSAIQSFLSPKCTSCTTKIPAKSSPDAVYVRCVQIYKSAFGKHTLKFFENGRFMHIRT